MNPSPIPADALLPYAKQRAEHLREQAARFHRRALIDPLGPAALQHAACISALAAQAGHLHELSGFADSIGQHEAASCIDALIDDTWAGINELAHEVRMASIAQHAPAMPEVREVAR